MPQARLPSIIRDVGGGAPGDDPGCCGVPPEVPRAVTAARLCIVLSIVIHAISLFVEGFSWEWQRNAAFGVFAVGGLVLCIYDQYMYAIGGLGFAACTVFDIFAVVRWITGDDEIFEDSDDDRWCAFEESSDDDSNGRAPPSEPAREQDRGARTGTALCAPTDSTPRVPPTFATPRVPPEIATPGIPTITSRRQTWWPVLARRRQNGDRYQPTLIAKVTGDETLMISSCGNETLLPRML